MNENDFGFYDDFDSLQSSTSTAEEVGMSAGYENHNIGVIKQRLADVEKNEIILCVSTIKKTKKGKKKAGTAYNARYAEIVVKFANKAEALASFSSLNRGYYVAFTDENELVAVLTGSFSESNYC